MFHSLLQADHGESVHRRHRIISDFGDQGDILVSRQTWNEVVELEYEADVPPAVGGQATVIEGCELLVLEKEPAACGLVEPADHVEQSRLAAARGPEQNNDLPGSNVEIDPAER